jgi:hypothetical protein
MQDNDGENVQAWHECGLDDGLLWEIHAYDEIESQCVTVNFMRFVSNLDA